MKKITVKFITIIIFISALGLHPRIIKAEEFDDLTLAQMEAQYATALANYNANSATIAANEVKIQENQKRIVELETLSKKTQVSIDESIINIDAKTIEISDMSEKIQKSAGLFQRMDIANIFLEYLMNSESLNDFSRKADNAQILLEYQNELFVSFKDAKLQLENLKVSLEEQKATLEANKIEAANIIETMKKSNIDITVENLSQKSQMEAATQAMEAARSLNCSTDETYRACVERQVIKDPTSKGFRRPVASGMVTSEYGPRDLFGSFHNGIDTAGQGSNYGSPVYLPAAGQIVASGIDPCGGNYIKAIFSVNGVYYTSTFYHLSAKFVSVGQQVDSDTVVANVGSTGYCTTGPHLHFEVSRSLFTGTNYNEYKVNLINPREVVFYPELGVSFSGR